MNTKNHKKRFTVTPVYRHVRLRGEGIHYLRERSSFWIAALSLLAFITGNMLGTHGWYAFWRAVIGGFDDRLITYTGTVPPIAFVPDPGQWQAAGAGTTYRDIPQELLIPLPSYLPQKPNSTVESSSVYAIGHMGSYVTGSEGEGSHPGVDVRLPEGTPIRSIANGIVTQVRESEGFGKLIVIRHPHMPDPKNPTTATVLHSVYAHLHAQFVTEGEIVQKGQEIGLSGSTGIVTGPHLHFQIDRDSAPWHPYWPFTGTELDEAGLTLSEGIDRGFHRERGYAHTVNPVLYTQANFPPLPTQEKESPPQESAPAPVKLLATEASQEEQRAKLLSTMIARRERRTERRLVRQRFVEKLLTASAGSPDIAIQHLIVSTLPWDPQPQPPPAIASVNIQHDGSFRDGNWELLSIQLLDANGDVIANPPPLHLQMTTGYGDAEFQPPTLSELDFQNGLATVRMRPQGRRTIVIRVLPLESLSTPMRYGS